MALVAVGQFPTRPQRILPPADEFQRRQRPLHHRGRLQSATSLPGRSAPTMTFSSTVMPRNTRMFWNVRDSPRAGAQMRRVAGDIDAGQSVIGPPSGDTARSTR